MCQNCEEEEQPCTCECADEEIMTVKNFEGVLEEYLCLVCAHSIASEEIAKGI